MLLAECNLSLIVQTPTNRTTNLTSGGVQSLSPTTTNGDLHAEHVHAIHFLHGTGAPKPICYEYRLPDVIWNSTKRVQLKVNLPALRLFFNQFPRNQGISICWSHWHLKSQRTIILLALDLPDVPIPIPLIPQDQRRIGFGICERLEDTCHVKLFARQSTYDPTITSHVWGSFKRFGPSAYHACIFHTTISSTTAYQAPGAPSYILSTIQTPLPHLEGSMWVSSSMRSSSARIFSPEIATAGASISHMKELRTFSVPWIT